MKLNQLRQLSDGELHERERELFEQLHKSRFESHDEDAKNPGLAGNYRREIARIKTILRERELETGKAQNEKTQ